MLGCRVEEFRFLGFVVWVPDSRQYHFKGLYQ